MEEDAARRIWIIEELLEQGSVLSEEEYAALAQDRNPWIPYGSTLAALLVTEEFFLALQIGDGEVVTLSREGDFAWPMPESMVNQGRFTASLCMGDPMTEFRHCLSRELPAAVLAYTDGVEKAFPPHSRALVEFLYAVWRVARQGDADEVQSALEAVARLGSVKDDATLTGVINTAVDISVPRLDELQRAEELQRIHARMNECSSALAYNAARLQQMDRLTREGAAAVGQMEQIMQRCSQQLAELREAEQRLMEAADETVDMGPE
ncbi:MAG: protein phosphatase 2C domain-containing protein [Clostridia bacterium]|nr:protein phosphatase 2C domain-containing protein [Clostridia bacterium]